MRGETSSIIDRRTVTRTSLVFTSAGDHNRVREWLGPDRSFDLFVVYYGDSPAADLESLADVFCRRNGVKFLNLAWAAANAPCLFAQYEAIFVLDDDINIRPDAIELLFDLRRNLGLWLVQPAFSGGKISHPITRRQEQYLLRFTDFVEMTAPLFRTRELLSFLREFDGSLLGWGTDWWYMNHLLARRDWERKIAVVDAAPCENPLDIEKPNGRELNRVGTVETRRDQWLRAKAARRLREFEPREYGAIRQGTVAAAVARLGFVARWWGRWLWT